MKTFISEIEAVEQFEEKEHQINIAYDKVNQKYIAYTDEGGSLGIGNDVTAAKQAYINAVYDLRAQAAERDFHM